MCGGGGGKVCGGKVCGGKVCGGKVCGGVEGRYGEEVERRCMEGVEGWDVEGRDVNGEGQDDKGERRDVEACRGLSRWEVGL